MPKSLLKTQHFNSLREKAEQSLKNNSAITEKITIADMYELIHELNVHQIELEMQNDELQKALIQLEESQNRYLELYEFSPVSYFSLDENNLIAEVNLAGAQLLGVARGQLNKKRFSRFITHAYQSIFYQHRQCAYATKDKQKFELELIKNDGTLFYAYLEGIVVENSITHSNELRLSILDITARKQAEKALQQAEEHMRQHQCELYQAAKMGSMGEMASALAHELTQPLTAINSFVNGCVRRMETGLYQPDELLAAMQQAQQQAQRAGDIIHHMKDFMRKGKSYYSKIEISDIINSAVALIKKEMFSTQVKIHLKLLKSPIFLMADNIQLELVILNLLRNGIEAMENKIGNSKPELTISTKTSADNLLIISIADTGPGFDELIADKLFDPCFTTKPNGLGMGLSICRTIIEAHGGQISAKIRPQGGACFECVLPINSDICHDSK